MIQEVVASKEPTLARCPAQMLGRPFTCEDLRQNIEHVGARSFLATLIAAYCLVFAANTVNSFKARPSCVRALTKS